MIFQAIILTAQASKFTAQWANLPAQASGSTAQGNKIAAQATIGNSCISLSQICRQGVGRLLVLVVGLLGGGSAGKEDAEFGEEVERGEGDHEGEGVARGGYDGSQHQQDDDGVATVFAQEGFVDDAQLGQEPDEQRQLKHKPDDENHHKEVVHVGVEVDLVGNLATKLILRQEAEHKGEDDAVADDTSEVEHAGAEEEGEADGARLIFIERRADELPQLVDEDREGKHKRQPERSGDVGHELRGHVDVDELAGEIGLEDGQPTIEEEVAVRGAKDDGGVDVGHGNEADDHENQQHNHNAD